MEQSKPGYSLKPLIRVNKNLVYKGKKYPIDFSLIIKNSNYFYENYDQFKLIQDIIIPEDQIDIPEDSIICFISACQNEVFDINNSNVFPLYQLSLKYEIPCLLSLTSEYIEKFNKSLIFQSIQFQYKLQQSNKTTKTFNLEKLEEMVASNFFEYINNDQLQELPIQVLYQIINHPKLDSNKMSQENKNLLIDFLFNCLKKHNRKASVLFSNIDFGTQRIEIFSKLNNEYSDVFDFNMINNKFLMNTTTDLLSEMLRLKENYSNSLSEINQLLTQIKSENLKQQDQLNQERKQMKESLENMRKQYEEQFNKLKEESSKNYNEIKTLVDQNNGQMVSFITKDQLKTVLIAAKGNSGEHSHFYEWWDCGNKGTSYTAGGGNGYFYDYDKAIAAIPGLQLT